MKSAEELESGQVESQDWNCDPDSAFFTHQYTTRLSVSPNLSTIQEQTSGTEVHEISQGLLNSQREFPPEVSQADSDFKFIKTFIESNNTRRAPEPARDPVLSLAPASLQSGGGKSSSSPEDESQVLSKGSRTLKTVCAEYSVGSDMQNDTKVVVGTKRSFKKYEATLTVRESSETKQRGTTPSTMCTPKARHKGGLEDSSSSDGAPVKSRGNLDTELDRKGKLKPQYNPNSSGKSYANPIPAPNPILAANPNSNPTACPVAIPNVSTSTNMNPRKGHRGVSGSRSVKDVHSQGKKAGSPNDKQDSYMLLKEKFYPAHKELRENLKTGFAKATETLQAANKELADVIPWVESQVKSAVLLTGQYQRLVQGYKKLLYVQVFQYQAVLEANTQLFDDLLTKLDLASLAKC